MRVLRVLNRQKSRALDRRFFGQIIRAVLEESLGRESYELGVHLIGEKEMALVNETFLRHRGSTDVLTFNHGADGKRAETLHGEIFICVDEALIQARRFRVSWQTEIARYLIHGLLHLEGFDDAKPRPRRAMKRRENKLLNSLCQRFDLGRLGPDKQASGSHERR